VKSREEIELIVDNQQGAIELMARLGYDVVLTFEKHRESWQLEKCKVELDSLPELGCFIEIECPTQADVRRVQDKLGLSNVDGVLQTYPDLVAHHLSDRGARETKLTFR
jgi:predicted adenylyl cyclase CyaB